MALLRLWYSLQQEVCLRSVSGTLPGLRNNNRMDQNEGVLRHPADCPSLFEGNKGTEKKNKCTGELLRDREGTCWTDKITSSTKCFNECFMPSLDWHFFFLPMIFLCIYVLIFLYISERAIH